MKLEVFPCKESFMYVYDPLFTCNLNNSSQWNRGQLHIYLLPARYPHIILQLVALTASFSFRVHLRKGKEEHLKKMECVCSDRFLMQVQFHRLGTKYAKKNIWAIWLHWNCWNSCSWQRLCKCNLKPFVGKTSISFFHSTSDCDISPLPTLYQLTDDWQQDCPRQSFHIVNGIRAPHLDFMLFFKGRKILGEDSWVTEAIRGKVLRNLQCFTSDTHFL